jgi:methionyl-tRNA formyltransferase
MRLLFAGTPQTAVPSLHALVESRHDVVAVLTRPDAHVGRRGPLTPSPVALAAADAGLALLKPASIRTAEFAAQIRALDVEAVAVVAYGALIPEHLLAIPPRGWINLHFSLLPAWRGAAPVQAAIRAGDDVTGASTFLIEKGLDTGPVYGTVTESIRPTDTAGDLLAWLADSGARLLVATFDGLADGTLTAVPQPADGVSHAPKITVDDAAVDFRAPALAVDRLIRSVTPEPGAWTASRWGRLGLGPVTLIRDATVALAPGEIAAGKRDVLVGTASGPVRLSTVQQSGKRPLPAADWARGARIDAGDRLGEPDRADPHRAQERV